MSNINFKDNLILESGKFLKWYNPSNNNAIDIIGVNTSNNILMYSFSTGNMFLNPDKNSSTFINFNNTASVFIGNKLSIGHTSSSISIDQIISLKPSSFIGMQNSSGYFGLSSSDTFNNNSSRIQLNNNTSGIQLLTGINGGFNVMTGFDVQRLNISNDGLLNYTPNGINPMLQISTTSSSFFNDMNIFGGVRITSTNNVSLQGLHLNFNGTSRIITQKGLGLGGLSFETSNSSGNIVSNMLIKNDGSIFIFNTDNSSGIGTGGSMTISGGLSIGKDLFVGGAVNSYSDIRLKTNIVSLENVLDKLNNINPIYFNYTEKSGLHTSPNIGFIAQDFIHTFPELLTLSSNNKEAFYALDYSKFCVVLLKAIKEMDCKIKELEKQFKNI